MLILKQNTPASVPTPASGKGTIFLSDSDVLSVKSDSGAVESFPTVGGTNTQVTFNDEDSLGGVSQFVFDKATNVLTVTGNIATTRVLTDNLLYANGEAWDLQVPAGANTQIIFNDNGNFGADSLFTFDTDTNILAAPIVTATTLNGTLGTAAQTNITSVGTLTSLLSGASASSADFGNAVGIFSADNTGKTFSDQIGLVGEAQGDAGDVGITGIGVYGIGKTAGATKGTGVYGLGAIDDTTDTGAAVGVRGVTTDIHASGYNIGVFGTASGSSIGNYGVYIQEGGIATIENACDWAVVDNSANAVTWSSTGKANIFLIESTDNAEGVGTSGYLNVTGNITAIAGIKTDNYYYANGSPVDFQQPAGSNTEVIFNDDGDFGADATFTFDTDTNILSAPIVTATTLNGTLGTAAQTAITSVGTLSGLTVTNPITGSITGSSGSATGTAATVTTAAQPNITSTGTLTALTVTGNVGAGNVNGTGGVFTYVSGDGANLTSLAGSEVIGEVDFAQVANAVAGANVSGEVDFAATANAVAGANVSGEVDFAATANAVAGANVSGTVALATTSGTVSTAAQPNITSVGTLSGLSINGTLTAVNITANTGIFTGDGSGLTDIAGANVSGAVALATSATSANAVAGANVSGTVALATSATSANAVAGANVSGAVAFATTANAVAGANVSGAVAFATTANAVAGANVSGEVDFAQVANAVAGANVSGTVALATTAGTVTTAAQPNITSVGTLSSVTTTGNVDTTGNVVTDAIIGKSAGITLTAIGTDQPITLIPTGTGAVAVSSKRITDLATPTASTDAATKQYVDDVAQGLAVQAPGRVATASTLTSITGGTVTYNNGTAGVGATLTTSSGTFNTIDGVTTSTNDRILVKDESEAANNGIYVKTSATVLTRASDFDTPTEMAGGDFVFIQQGTVYNDSGWVMTDPVTTVGTSGVNFVQFSGAGTYTAGAGLTLTGTEFSITNTAVTAQSYGNGTHNATFTVNSKGQMTAGANVAITANAQILTGTSIASGVTGSSLTSVGTISSGTWQGTSIGSSYVSTLNQNTTGYAGTVSVAAQPNITSVGTLSALSVTATITGSVSGSAATATSATIAATANAVAGANVSGTVALATTAGTVSTAAQPNITSVGTLSGLTVSSTITGSVSGSAATATSATTAGSVTTAAQGNITSVGVLTSLNSSGTITAPAFTANTGVFTGDGSGLSTLNASNVSSGTLAQARLANDSVTVNGSTVALGASTTITASTTQSVTFNNSGSGVSSGTTFNGGTARIISYNTIGAPSTSGSGASGSWGISVTGTAASATGTAATVTTAAQPNITSVGTLSSLTVSGITNTGTMQSTIITTGSNSTAGTITGDYTLTSGSTLNATYADLAEKYTADAQYEAGTVVTFGGEAECSIAGVKGLHAVAGVVTTNPAQVYNAGCVAPEGQFVIELALIGRVPCKIIGPIEKGDLIITSDQAGYGCAGNPATVKAGTIIGKALEAFNGPTPEGVVEVLVGKT